MSAKVDVIEKYLVEETLTEEQKNQYYIGTHTWIYVWNEDNQTWNLTNFKV